MAMPISPMIWNKAAIEDNRLLPGRYSLNIFTGKGVKIANNEEAYAYDDIIVSDRIFDYDDRRLNGLEGANSEGRDGWGASAYGPFQTVRFTRRVFTSGQHKSIAWRVFDEKQYAGGIGQFGTATESYAYTGGEAYMSTSETINRAKKIWDAEILGPHIDKYNFFAVANGHIAGRFVQTDAAQGKMFQGDASQGSWIASPGPYPGLSFAPEFAPIKAVQWDSGNARQILNAIDVAWTNLYIPKDNRVVLLDGAYKDELLSNYIGIPGTVPATESAYKDLREGTFERLGGWDFDFSIPSQYFPKVYLDDNLNVVHSAAGTGAYDALLNSIAGTGRHKLTQELAANQRMRATNYIGTYWDTTNDVFVNEITNYPLGMPNADDDDVYGEAYTATETISVAGSSPYAMSNPWKVTQLSDFPWQGWPGQGLNPGDTSADYYPLGPSITGSAALTKVIGMVVYRPAAQLGQEYGYMETARGGTRGKFTELVFDMKHDAWVIPNLSHGIILLVDGDTKNIPTLKVETVAPQGEVTKIECASTLAITAGAQKILTPTVSGTGNFEKAWIATSSANAKATISELGVVTGVTAGSATITFTAVGDPSKTATCAVTVS